MDIKFQMGDVKFNFRVAGVWVNKGHVLIHRIEHEPFWSLPGGRVAIGEESETSIKREFEEELGIHINVERLIGTSENFFIHNEKKVHEIGFYYKVSSEEGDILKKSGEFYGVEDQDKVYKWVPVDLLSTIDLRPDFLYKVLRELPNVPQHWITSDTLSL